MKIKDYWPTVLWAFVILALTVAPSHKIPEPPDWSISADKLVHFLMFMILSLLLLFRRYSNGRLWNHRQLIPIIVLLTTYGLLLEMVQLLVPGRDFSWLDLISDAMGAIAGNYIYLGAVKLKEILANR